MSANTARVIEHWTQGRRDSATPRDLVIDPRGLGYLRRSDGSLEPHGHQIRAIATSNTPTPLARPPGGNNDTTPPTIVIISPSSDEVIGELHTFSATVSDASGVRSVSFIIHLPGGTTETFQAANQGADQWSVTLQGFTTSTGWSWQVDARDNAKKGGNRVISDPVFFSVDTGGGGGGGSTDSDTITNANWTSSPHYSTNSGIQKVTGRLYFEMPKNARRRGPWAAYVCSGTVVTDDTNGRSIILTAAHCVYDDVNGAYARNVLFIPDQAATTGSGSDRNCGNDPYGCWVPTRGVVDVNWTMTTFPSNIPWDYGYYAVEDDSTTNNVLDTVIGSLSVNFTAVYVDAGSGALSLDYTHALGYSYNEDPKLMYCAENIDTLDSANWWLSSCGLSGGSSGGPWIQLLDPLLADYGYGSLEIVSLNSWGYTDSPGMAGPVLDLSASSAECVFTGAKNSDLSVAFPDGDAGSEIICP